MALEAEVGEQDDLHSLDEDLRQIALDNGPQPLRLDRVFNRARRWKPSPTAVSPTEAPRPPSPPRARRIFPLPRPLPEDQATSPLSGLFDYPELLPLVLDQFERPSEWAVLARVSRSWCALARKRLYEHVWVRPWESSPHFKLVLLFDTLHKRPELCRLVKYLDVRFYPLATTGEERYELDEHVQKALAAMENLEHLTWTRDKSLTPKLVETIVDLDHLRSLEVSGHSRRYYEPRSLGGLPKLEDLRVMMPDPHFRDGLLPLVKDLEARTMGGLRGLGIIHLSSPLVDDKLLKSLAPYLTKLKRLILWGCIKITREGVYEVLRSADGIEELSLDAVPHSGIEDMSSAPEMPYLRTFSLSFSSPKELTLGDMPILPSVQSLRSLHLTLSGERKHIPYGGLEALTSRLNFGDLRRLSILGMVIGPQTLSTILQIAPKLDELYISINGKKTLQDCPDLAGCSLKVFHVTAPERWGPDGEDMKTLARSMPSLEQLGSGTRVYEVSRRYEGDEVVVELHRWSRTTAPGYFQIWRG